MPKPAIVTQRKPVSWLAPKGLLQTGIKTLQASLFSSYADRRETIAALSPDETKPTTKPISYAGQNEVWFDYIADTGDGWNPTYAIACLASGDTLRVLPPIGSKDKPVELPRADFTVLGGDEVYPTASPEDYKDRLTDPYWCAQTTDKDLRKVYALPGNHDWYDGLTSFMRLFMQKGRRLGPWQADQRRTYFAIELPHNWWIWGVDVQLQSDLDAPQVEYFKHYARKLNKGDRVILCTPEPSWVEGADDRIPGELADKSKTHDNLIEIEQRILERKAEIPLRIAGDLHHYARYEGRKDKAQLVTCGGGGAFLHSTHPLPPDLDLRKTFGQWFDQKVLFPSAEWCKKQRKKVFWLIWTNRGFAATLGAIYALYAWILETTSESLVDYPGEGLSLLDYFATIPGLPFEPWWSVVQNSPLAIALTIGIVWGPKVYGVTMKRVGSLPYLPALGGIVHGLLHLGAATMLAWLLSPLASYHLLLALAGIFFAGAFAGGIIMAAYLYIANVAYGCHDEEVFSCQAIEDYKCFTRIHVTKKAVTLYPIGLESVPRDWVPGKGVIVNSKSGPLEPTYDMSVPPNLKRIFEPAPPYTLTARLIEPPFRIG